MSSNSALDKRKNKSFVINNKRFLKQYALKNYNILGQGIIVVNLLLLEEDIIDEEKVVAPVIGAGQELTVHQPISYIPQKNFWFKMLSLKIKKKYDIDIKSKSDLNKKFLVVFIKDASIEYFSIYSLKV